MNYKISYFHLTHALFYSSFLHFASILLLTFLLDLPPYPFNFLEELFMDYGSDYDRSNYKMPEPAAEPIKTDVTQEVEKKIVKVEAVAAVKDEPKKVAVTPPISTASASMFDGLIGNKMAADKGTAPHPTPTPSCPALLCPQPLPPLPPPPCCLP